MYLTGMWRSCPSGPSAAEREAGRASPPMAVELAAVCKSYRTRAGTVLALDGVTVSFRSGTFSAVMGSSGSGKSTLLHCAAGLDRVSSGVIRIGGSVITDMSAHALTLLRRDRIGFVFQSFNLIPSLTARQNVELPRRLAGRHTCAADVDSVLSTVGMSGRADHRPSELSGGQQQRVAIARALITKPHVVFADEPTGALDSVSSRQVLDVLRRAVDEHGLTVVMVTHDPSAAAFADRVVMLHDGSVAGVLATPTADALAARLAASEQPR